MGAAPFSAIALRDAIARREISAESACRQALDRIEQTNGSLNAFLHVAADRALTRARALDARSAPAGPLRRWRLLEVGAGETLAAAPLRIDERVLHYLAGISYALMATRNNCAFAFHGAGASSAFTANGCSRDVGAG